MDEPLILFDDSYKPTHFCIDKKEAEDLYKLLENEFISHENHEVTHLMLKRLWEFIR